MSRERKGLAVIADSIASCFEVGEAVDWDRIRDIADVHTGGDLDCMQLDILTDMVERRIKALPTGE